MGICNGFQILTELGILHGALLRNINLRFLCMDQRIEIVRNDTPFTSEFKKGEEVVVPIAHFDGRYYIPEDKKSLVEPLITLKYIENPNGSLMDVAGIVNDKNNVLGLMPHPERNSEKIIGDGNAIRFFVSVYNEVRPHA